MVQETELAGSNTTNILVDQSAYGLKLINEQIYDSTDICLNILSR